MRRKSMFVTINIYALTPIGIHMRRAEYIKKQPTNFCEKYCRVFNCTKKAPPFRFPSEMGRLKLLNCFFAASRFFLITAFYLLPQIGQSRQSLPKQFQYFRHSSIPPHLYLTQQTYRSYLLRRYGYFFPC